MRVTVRETTQDPTEVPETSPVEASREQLAPPEDREKRREDPGRAPETSPAARVSPTRRFPE